MRGLSRMQDLSRLDLYKARYRKWRATSGSVEWHRACAVIRAYNGESLAARMHEFIASFSETLDKMLEAVANALTQSPAYQLHE